MTKKVSTLDEIRAQAEPEVIEIPGFRAGKSIAVRVRLIDLTPKLLELRVANPLLAEAQRMAQGGMTRDEIAAKLDGPIADIVPMLDEIAKESLVEPTYDEIVAIHPLTLAQKLKLFSYATGEDVLGPFRG